MQLTVTVPMHIQKEIAYTVAVLLGEYLEVKYQLTASTYEANFSFEYGDRKLVIENYFFTSDNVEALYISEKLPTEVCAEKIELRGVQLPVTLLYGKNRLSTVGRDIHYKGDLLSSTFFMLSRWEETLEGSRDAHDRFTAKMSTAHKFGFLDRPIVNEYLEVLWQLLLMIGYDQKRKEHNYKCVPTHDVDHPFMWSSTLNMSKSLAAKFAKGKVGELKRALISTAVGKDPWDTFTILMDQAEAADVKANFYFMAEGSSKWDGTYKLSDGGINKTIKEIKNRGHLIGFHPSYKSMDNADIFVEEKEKLEQSIGEKVYEGRQHFLRIQVPSTWQIWQQNGMTSDSTMGYADHSGFRCGTCYPFTVFDVVKRAHLALVERPLLVMDVTLQKYEKLNSEAATAKVLTIKKEVKKHNGEYVFLWHNSSFFTDEWKDYNETWLACYR